MLRFTYNIDFTRTDEDYPLFADYDTTQLEVEAEDVYDADHAVEDLFWTLEHELSVDSLLGIDLVNVEDVN